MKETLTYTPPSDTKVLKEPQLTPREHLAQLINDVRAIHTLDAKEIERRDELAQRAGGHALHIVHTNMFKQLAVKSYLDEENNQEVRTDVLRLLSVANDEANNVIGLENPRAKIHAIKRHTGTKRRLGLE